MNRTAEKATGDILIFSDATGIYNAQTIRELAANFNDPTIGCVTGKVVYSYGKDANSLGFRAYQWIAVAIRRAESFWGAQTSVSGSIHAIRRDVYKPCPIEMSPDVIDALNTVLQGYRVVYEANAISLEESRKSLADEFKCRIRIGVRANSMIPYLLTELLKHRKFKYAVQMISHKIFRWWLWFLLLMTLVTNLVLIGDSDFYTFIAVGQCFFYLTSLTGLAFIKAGISCPILSSVVFFLVGNTAMAVGAIKFIMGKRMSSWEPVREKIK